MAGEGSSSSYNPEEKNCLFDGYSTWQQTSHGEISSNQTNECQTSSNQNQANWEWIPEESSSNWISAESTSNWVPNETISNQFQAIDETSTINWIQETEEDGNPFIIPEDPTTQSF